MKKYWQVLSLLWLITFLIIIRTPSVASQRVIIEYWSSKLENTLEIVVAQAGSQSDRIIAPEIPERQSSAVNNKEEVPVVLDGEILFNYSSEIEGFPAEARARQTAQKVQEVAKNSAIPIDSLKIVELEGLRVITAREEPIVTLLEADARAANLPLNELAEEYLQKVREAIARYRERNNWQNSLLPALSAVVELIVAIVLLILLGKILTRVNRQIDTWRSTLLRPLRIQSLQLLSVEQEANLLKGLIKLIYRVIVVVILFIYLSSLTRYFPQTRGVGRGIFNYLESGMRTAGKAAIAYLPNLFTIILTIIVAYYIIRFCQLFFSAIDRQTLTLPKFDREWAKPTEKLAIFLIAALAFTVIFPLLPGAQSPAFQGISIFIGALFTLGGASAIANLVGGVVIIYTRAFRVGDFVQIDNVKGDILEKTILSTRIRTSKNKIITIPNANLLVSNIENFTTSFRDVNQHLILHTTITLGYDVPWRKVHQILIQAACLCPSILKEPAPFVLQTSLGDFAVSYELNAYTDRPSMMSKTYSQLHQNIQDKCNEAGIEILSPQYSAIRDGNQSTIPEDYLPQNYRIPGFRFHPLGQLFNRPGDRGDEQTPKNRK
ncbi:mechanosensitive ion channel family protein [Myxosarcina sp. GI1(2024)]